MGSQMKTNARPELTSVMHWQSVTTPLARSVAVAVWVMRVVEKCALVSDSNTCSSPINVGNTCSVPRPTNHEGQEESNLKCLRQLKLCRLTNESSSFIGPRDLANQSAYGLIRKQTCDKEMTEAFYFSLLEKESRTKTLDRTLAMVVSKMDLTAANHQCAPTNNVCKIVG